MVKCSILFVNEANGCHVQSLIVSYLTTATPYSKVDVTSV